MMNKMFGSFMVLSILFAGFQRVAAQSLPVAPMLNSDIQVVGNQAIVTFAELGYNDANLISPYDSTSVLFSIPPNWRLVEGAEVQLNLDVFVSGSLAESANAYTGSLSVVFNNLIIGSISLGQSGSQSIRFSIPADALTSSRRDGRHVLTILLNAQFSCTSDLNTLVILRSTSVFTLPFATSVPVLDLANLPAPFHLRNSLFPDHVLLVVPDAPSPMELQSALNVTAGFGSMVGREIDFRLVSAAQLIENDLASSHLIFVGRPDQFNQLDGIDFPLPLDSGKIIGLAEESSTEGIVQMALSPWNTDKVIMLVSGMTDEAVSKAAKAVSSGRMIVFDNPALIRVADVHSFENIGPIKEDITLQELGYVTETLEGIGVSSVDYLFTLSQNQVGSREAYFDLIYYHSGLADYGVSSLALYLNDQIVSSVAFKEESESVTTARIKFPPGVLRFGENRLSIRARMQPDLSCDTTGFSDPWVTIVDQSQFHLPVVLGSETAPSILLDLKFFPSFLQGYSDLSDVAFVLPKSNPQSWSVAAKLAYFLGQVSVPSISNLTVVYADDVPQEVRSQYSLVVVGKASDLPLVLEINDNLPAPFDFSDNTASERQLQIVYRLPPGVSVGYLEVLRSPFNAEKAVLVIAGNTDEGLPMAGNALTQGALASQLAGSFAVTNGVQVVSGRLTGLSSIVGTLVPQGEPVVATPLPQAPAAGKTLPPPAWLLPVVFLSGLTGLGVVIFVILNSLSRRRVARIDESLLRGASETVSPESKDQNGGE